LGRKAKCRACGKELDTITAFKLIEYDTNNKEKRFYYCSRDEYEQNEAEKEKAAADKDRVYRLICDIIGRKEILNSILWKEKTVWNKVSTDGVIAQYLEQNKDYLTGVISRLEDKEFNRIRYLSAIIKNSIGDFKPKTIVKETIRTVTDEHYETKFKPKARKALGDFEEDFDE
jgi:hypothetical protein